MKINIGSAPFYMREVSALRPYPPQAMARIATIVQAANPAPLTDLACYVQASVELSRFVLHMLDLRAEVVAGRAEICVSPNPQDCVLFEHTWLRLERGEIVDFSVPAWRTLPAPSGWQIDPAAYYWDRLEAFLSSDTPAPGQVWYDEARQYSPLEYPPASRPQNQALATAKQQILAAVRQAFPRELAIAEHERAFQFRYPQPDPDESEAVYLLGMQMVETEIQRGIVAQRLNAAMSPDVRQEAEAELAWLGEFELELLNRRTQIRTGKK